MHSIETKTITQTSALFSEQSDVPVLLMAYVPRFACTVDRCMVSFPYVIGRSAECQLIFEDPNTSKRHACLTKDDTGFWIEDLGSTNGIFLERVRLTDKQPFPDKSVLRIGQNVLVFHAQDRGFLNPPPIERYGIVGRFHVSGLLKDLDETVLSGRHVLLAGPSGSGKELAANAIAKMMSDPGKTIPVLAYNAARYTSEDEITSTLFGVGPRVFSGVDARPGLIEQAHGGILFLDEVHNLPERVQRTLLRVIEEGELTRIGETRTRKADVRFVFASNAQGPTHSLAHDFFARLRVVRVPSMRERAADIPSIFDHLLRERLSYYQLDVEEIMSCFGGEHYEALCVHGFVNDNVRGIKDLAERIATRIAKGEQPPKAITQLFNERFSSPPSTKPLPSDLSGAAAPDGSTVENQSPNRKSRSSSYEQNKGFIIAVYYECDGNISATKRTLLERGIKCSNRWLSIFLERWGVR